MQSPFFVIEYLVMTCNGVRADDVVVSRVHVREGPEFPEAFEGTIAHIERAMTARERAEVVEAKDGPEPQVPLTSDKSALPIDVAQYRRNTR